MTIRTLLKANIAACCGLVLLVGLVTYIRYERQQVIDRDRVVLTELVATIHDLDDLAADYASSPAPEDPAGQSGRQGRDLLHRLEEKSAALGVALGLVAADTPAQQDLLLSLSQAGEGLDSLRRALAPGNPLNPRLAQALRPACHGIVHDAVALIRLKRQASLQVRHWADRAILTVAASAALALGLSLLAYRKTHAQLEQMVRSRTAELEDSARQLRRESEERGRAEAEAARRVGMLAAVLDALNDGLIVLDRRGRIAHLNEVARRVFGYTDEEAALPLPERMQRVGLEREAGVPVPVDQLPGARALAGEAVAGEVLRLVRPGREPVWVSMNAAPFRDGPGCVAGAAVTFQDIGARLRAEAEVNAAREAAEAANRAKSAFLATMSHEIRTPMNGILGMTELALLAAPGRRIADYLRMVRTSGLALLEIINDILDLSKIEAGKVELRSEPFSLAETLDSVLAPLRLTAEAKGVGFGLALSPDLPDRLVGDRGRLNQVLINLVGNAVKFTDQGSVSVTVAPGGPVRPSQDSRVRLLVTVRDTGIGIPPDSLPRLFESFSQVGASAHAKYGGTGLGLAIAQSLVGMMQGSIKVDSAPGRGSVFTFTALFGTAPACRPAPEAAAEPAQPAGGTGPLRVLVVEDNLVSRVLATSLLESLGHRAASAGDGREALDALAASAYDLVLMDVKMPGMDGLEATHLIRTGTLPGVDPAIPVVALTAHALDGDRERFLAAGMTDYLTKPVDQAGLERVLSRFRTAA